MALWEDLGRVQKSPEVLWEAVGRVQKSPGRALGGPIYRQTPDQPTKLPGTVDAKKNKILKMCSPQAAKLPGTVD